MNRKKYSNEVKETAKNIYASNNNYSETANSVGVSEGTIRQWAKKWKEDPEFEKLREEKSKTFADKATQIINSGMNLLQWRFDRALIMEKEIDILLQKISEDSECSISEINNISKKIAELKLQNVREITTAIGTMYDKRALANGESTDNAVMTIVLPDGADEYAG